jgi:plastocyanin
MVSCRAVRSSSPERIADLHRVTLAVRVICQVRGPTTPSGVGPFSRWKLTPTHVIAGQTIDPVNPRPSRHDTPSGLAAASRRYHRLPLLGGAALGQAKRSEEIDGTANQWQPAQVAIEPGGTVTFRIAGGQTHPVGSGQAPPEDRRFDASKCQPRTSPRSGTLAR